MKKPTVGMINLGCVRNTVDAQHILGRLKEQGHDITLSESADVVIVNTCSFINDAKKESVDVIVDLIEQKKQGKIKKIIVAGCLAERYAKDLVNELPEVDAFVGVQALSQKAQQESVLLTPPYFAYLKICESCFNQCSFCVIPKIKGRFVSREIPAIIDEARGLEQQGVRELNIVGQDISAYGLDLYREKKLAELLRRLVKDVRGIEWLRLLYAYPSHVTDELLEVIAREPRICKYLDVPLQHVSDPVLKAMNRHITKDQTIKLLEKIRKTVPGAAIRTTFIVGFPGETEKQFEELVSFIEDHPFEKVGVFTYSREEGTKAFNLPRQVPEPVKQERLKRLMNVQKTISRNLLKRRVGSTLKVLVENRLADTMDMYLARSEFDAPDVDGRVFVKSSRRLMDGEFVEVKITRARDYDLEGETA